MGKDILVILMVAFGLFALIMFVFFFVYLKRYYNTKHIEEDYKKDIEDNEKMDDIIDVAPSVPEVKPLEPDEVMPNIVEVSPIVEETKEEPKKTIELEDEMDFIPIRKN